MLTLKPLESSNTLIAMKTNEDDTNTAYENMANRKDLSPSCMKLMKTCLHDERRHREWIEEAVRR